MFKQIRLTSSDKPISERQENHKISPIMPKSPNDSVNYERLDQQDGSGEAEIQDVVHDRVIYSFYNNYYEVKLSTLRYLTFLSIGVSLLWPWNSFLSASEYYITKFQHNPKLSSIYSSTMMTISTLSSVLMNTVLSTKQFANFGRRIYLGSTVNISIFLFLSFIEGVFPDFRNVGYFTLLMILISFSALGTAFQQNGCMALANVFGPIYAQAVMVGQAIAGVLPSISLVISNLLYSTVSASEEVEHPLPKRGTGGIVIYFLTTSFITSISVVLLYITSKYEETKASDESDTPPQPKVYVPFMTLFKQLKFLVLTVLIAFGITLVFPIFAANVTSVNNYGTFNNDEIFIPFIFFIWNLGDLIGRLLCGYESLVIRSDKVIFIYAILRSLFIPLLFLCNIHNHAVIKSDTFYIAIQLLFGITNGHCLSCAFMNVTKYLVDDDSKEAAGGFTTVFVSAGLALGSVVSYLFVYIIGTHF